MKRREIIRNLSVVPIAGAIAGCASGGSSENSKDDWTPKKELVAGSKSSASPLSLCIRSGHLLFVSGIGGYYPDRHDEPGDIKIQVNRALTTMQETLEKAGSNMANVLKVHMSVVDPVKNIGPLNEEYSKFFPDPKPARSYSGAYADQMGPNWPLIQIDCIAYVD